MRGRPGPGALIGLVIGLPATRVPGAETGSSADGPSRRSNAVVVAVAGTALLAAIWFFLEATGAVDLGLL